MYMNQIKSNFQSGGLYNWLFLSFHERASLCLRVFPPFGVRVSILLKIGDVDSSFGLGRLPISFFSCLIFFPFLLLFSPSSSSWFALLFLPCWHPFSSFIWVSIFNHVLEMVRRVLVLPNTTTFSLSSTVSSSFAHGVPWAYCSW